MFTIHMNRFKLMVAPIGVYDAPAPAVLDVSGFSERASAVD